MTETEEQLFEAEIRVFVLPVTPNGGGGAEFSIKVEV